ncbi:MAG TPA: hypothetical protein VLR26_12025 [Frankiaceae bacterium]|nr:hypothetical protein [Frankiaceae bacterium]
MTSDDKVLESLLTGLPKDDKDDLLKSIRLASDDQLDQKRHPRPRRRRNADGALESYSDGMSLAD